MTTNYAPISHYKAGRRVGAPPWGRRQAEGVIPSKEDFKGIRDLAELSLEQIKKDKRRYSDLAVNWGDLRIIEVTWCVPEYEGMWPYWKISVEECAQGSLEVILWENMGQRNDIEICCEW